METNLFAAAVANATKETRTENGAYALNTSNNALVDLYSTIGALRNTEDLRVQRLFSEAYKQDKLLATKIVFYGRDITEGLGERKTFRTLLKYMANYMPEALRPNLKYIGAYGRFDDLYELINTPLENDMWEVMKEQYEADRENFAANKPVSLLAKWIKTADASSEKTRALGIKTALKLGYNVRTFKRDVRALRKYLKVVEGLMSTNQWDKINYSAVPSKAMTLYRSAYGKHDSERFNEFINKAVNGEAKINSATLFPYDIMEKLLGSSYHSRPIISPDEYKVLEAQWRQLPNYVTPGSNVLIMADTSGSMWGRPLATSVGLAVYFAERNIGPFKDLFLTFDEHPTYQMLKGNTLAEKINSIKEINTWNTNLEAAFDLVLNTAIHYHIPTDQLPKAIVIISDMEIDQAACKDNKQFYDIITAKFEAAGYRTPACIFWNVNSRHDVFHADANRSGVQLVSGQSTTVFKQLVENIECTAYEAMLKVINSDRYAPITVE